MKQSAQFSSPGAPNVSNSPCSALSLSQNDLMQIALHLCYLMAPSKIPFAVLLCSRAPIGAIGPFTELLIATSCEGCLRPPIPGNQSGGSLCQSSFSHKKGTNLMTLTHQLQNVDCFGLRRAGGQGLPPCCLQAVRAVERLVPTGTQRSSCIPQDWTC